MKTCNICKVEKPLESFNKEKRNNSYRNYCKDCGKTASKNRGKTKDGVISSMYGSQKRCSVRRGHEQPNYSLLELKSWVFNNSEWEDLFSKWVLSMYDSDMKPSCLSHTC